MGELTIRSWELKGVGVIGKPFFPVLWKINA